MWASFIQMSTIKKGIYTCRKIPESRDVQEPPNDAMIQLIMLLLTKNNFTFNDQHFLQRKDLRLLLQLPPPLYAKILVDDKEKQMVASIYLKNTFDMHGGGTLMTFLLSVKNVRKCSWNRLINFIPQLSVQPRVVFKVCLIFRHKNNGTFNHWSLHQGNRPTSVHPQG